MKYSIKMHLSLGHCYGCNSLYNLAHVITKLDLFYLKYKLFFVCVL